MQVALQHLLAEAARRGYERLSLETGSMPGFEPARRLYERFGFTYCSPFADYTEDPEALAKDKSIEPGRRVSEGTFALQAHDPGSTVMYRNIKVKRLP